MINAITGIETSTAVQQTIGESSSLDKDAFLELLVAQIRYQNPLEPMDSQQFMAQTAQFTMVESLGHLADSQTEALSFHRATLSAQMLGNEVSGVDAVSGEAVKGLVTGVLFNAGSPQLIVGGHTVDLDSITDVSSSRSTSAATAPAGTAQATVPVTAATDSTSDLEPES